MLAEGGHNVHDCWVPVVGVLSLEEGVMVLEGVSEVVVVIGEVYPSSIIMPSAH